uniref:VOC domain-containing protein n=1 Tax=Neobodo designis TaxID=312471 RepID=A0A7S1M9T4_NEODS
MQRATANDNQCDATRGLLRGLIRPRRFDHVGIEVRDAEKSLAFYRDVLGFEQIRRPPFTCRGYWLVLGDSLQLHIAEAAASRHADLKRQRADRMDFKGIVEHGVANHFAFCVDGVAEARDRLARHNKTASADSIVPFHFIDRSHLTDADQLFVLDPDDNLIELASQVNRTYLAPMFRRTKLPSRL